MSRRLLIAVMTVAALGVPALAQSAAPDPVTSLKAPKVSDSDKAAPDWFRQFTFSSTADEPLPWQARPETDVALNWVPSNRWSLSIDLKSRDAESPLPREEMKAGAKFRITPRLSIGGELSVGANELEKTSEWDDKQVEAGIRLQSAFKF